MMLLPSGRANNNVLATETSLGTAEQSICGNACRSVQETSHQLPNVMSHDLAHSATSECAPAPFSAGPVGKSLLLSNSPGSHSERGTSTSGQPADVRRGPDLSNVTISASAGALDVMIQASSRTWQEIDHYMEDVQSQLKPGWTAHLGKEGRIYYCNHATKTSGWLPSCEDWGKHEDLPYGWERAVDSKGRCYFINHLTKTSTYEAPECVKGDDAPPEPRVVVLQRSPTMGFGFVAGSERPVIVRFVTEDGPSMGKLQPGDRILAVNGEDVKEAPRDRVIQLVRACDSQAILLVCQPSHSITPGRKSTLLSAGKRAKLRSRPSRVRFAESVCVNGSPLFPPSAFSLGDICVPPMANVLKVFLENGQTKSFKYDVTTTVQDVISSLLDKLCFTSCDIFSLVLEHVKSLKRNKLTLLDPMEPLAKIASRPGAHKLRCLFRVAFVPISASDLAQSDLNALDYLYLQCCNDVTQERFAPELQPDVALRLAALHMHQHALANNVQPSKLTVKLVEREFGLERFVPASLFDGMKRKELRRLISHFLKMNAEMTGSSSKTLTQLQAKLYYLDIIGNLPSYGAKCFSTNQRDGIERVLLVSPRFGLSQISSARNAVPQPIASIEDLSHITVSREDDITCSVNILMQGERFAKFYMEDRDACEFSLCLEGYYKLMTGHCLPVSKDRDEEEDDNAPSYLAQHTVLPASWSYLAPFQNKARIMNFLVPPPYHMSNIKEGFSLEGLSASGAIHHVAQSPISAETNMALISSTAMDVDIHSVVATELLEEAKDSGLSDSSGAGSNYGDRLECNNSSIEIQTKNEEVLRRVHEMQKMVENSEQYLNEQGDLVQMLKTSVNSSPYSTWQKKVTQGSENPAAGVITEFDSDCDSLNSSKLSSNDDASQQSSLKHSDSLALLVETINQDLSGITKSLTSIGSSPAELKRRKPTLIGTSSPRPERKVNGFSQLLSNLQAIGTDFSQSESDSESITSPSNSPTARRPSVLNTTDTCTRRKNSAFRSSFGLHSPDSSNFGLEAKDYNLKEYLKQLKEISNVESISQDTDVAAKKLSEIYGFEIREDTFIETDGDLIDLRAIPPPQTPDELDALSLLNAAPKGFGDQNKRGVTAVHDQDLDTFLEQVVVAPPTQKATPAKELTPEEIMSFIIPPPPSSDESEQITTTLELSGEECLYSNSRLSPTMECATQEALKTQKVSVSSTANIIEYATVERKGAFSCCPKSKKDTPLEANADVRRLKLPPRSASVEQQLPARPPKSAVLLQRYSPKKQDKQPEPIKADYGQRRLVSSDSPPELPPRTGPADITRVCGQEEGEPGTRAITMVSSLAPKKPPLPPIAGRQPVISDHLPGVTEDRCLKASTPTPPRITPSPNHPFGETPLLHRRQNLSALSENQIRPCATYQTWYSPQTSKKNATGTPLIQTRSVSVTAPKLIIKNGHVIDAEALLAKTDNAMAGLLVKLDQVAAQCTAAQSAGGGSSIDEDKFQKARSELTEQTLVLVTASKYLVVAMSDMSLLTLPEHLTSCLTAIRRIVELTEHMARHTSAPLQTRNIVLKVHDVASSFRELVAVPIGPLGAGSLALQAECLANVLATLLRSLRVFSP